MLKIALLLVKNAFFSLNESIRELLRQVAQKHTATFPKMYWSQVHDKKKLSRISLMSFI